MYIVVCWRSKDQSCNQHWKQYRNVRQEGRQDFQIDIGLLLLNTVIKWDVVDKEGRPAWIRQGPYIPCDCEGCYFCLNGHTTGIDQRRKRNVEICYANGAGRQTNQCTDDRVRLHKRSYCKMCYRSQPNNLSAAEKRGRCRWSRMGCVQCNETICGTCWDKGYDWHRRQKIVNT